jgi:hypothetical protein
MCSSVSVYRIYKNCVCIDQETKFAQLPFQNLAYLGREFRDWVGSVGLGHRLVVLFSSSLVHSWCLDALLTFLNM